MSKIKTTKSALLSSVIAMLICFSMLLGTTYAWFTDSVTSSGNIIKSGTLDVEMYWAKGTEDPETATWNDASEGAIFDYDKWEPGYVEVRHIKIANEGTLALKYKVSIIANGEVSDLADVIDVYYADPAVQVSDRTQLTDANKLGTLTEVLANLTDTANGELEAGKSDTITLALMMQTSAGNEYQNKSIGTDFSVQLLATQLTSESDSIDNQYDKDASYAVTVSTADELKSAIENAQDGYVIEFANDIDSVDGILITDKNITLDLNGHVHSISEGGSTNNRNFKINGSSEVVIKNGTLIADGRTNGTTSSGAYGTIRTEGNANVTLSNMNLYNYRGNGLNIKACSGSTVIVNDTNIYSQYGGGVEAAGGTVELNNVKVEQKGMWIAPYNSMAVSVNGGGKAIINSGNYTTECLTAEEAYNQGSSHGPWTIGVLNSGGTLVVNGGTFSNDNFGDNSLATYARGLILADTAAVIELNGGNYNAVKAIIDVTNNLGDASRNPVASLKGGTFSADPTVSGLYASELIKVAKGYEVTENNGVWTVAMIEHTVTNATELKEAIAEGGKVTLTEDIEVTEVLQISADTVIEGNGKAVKVSDTRGFRITVSDVNVALNNVVIDCTFVRVGTNDVRGISIDSGMTNIDITLNNCSVDFAEDAQDDWAYGVNICGNTTGVTLTVNGGTYEGANVINIWGAGNTVIIDGATLNCTYGYNQYYHGAGIRLNPGCSADIIVKNTTINGTHAEAFCSCGEVGEYTYTTENVIDNTTKQQ